jgi:hypothetical protein
MKMCAAVRDAQTLHHRQVVFVGQKTMTARVEGLDSTPLEHNNVFNTRNTDKILRDIWFGSG